MAASAGYVNRASGDRKTFKESGGDFTFTPKAVTNAAGRISARGDLGAFPRAPWVRWYAEIQCQATPTIDLALDIYLVLWDEGSDGATPALPSGNMGSTDAGISSINDTKNLLWIGQITVESATADKKFTKHGMLWLPYRYISVLWWNATGATLTNDAAEHVFAVIPAYEEAQ